MPKVDFCFSGYVRGAFVDTAVDINGKTVSVEDWTSKQLSKSLNSGKLFILLADHLYESCDTEVELFDFDAPI